MEKVYHNDHIEALRGCSKSRALLIYKLFEKAEQCGLNEEDFAREVIWECGCFRAEHHFPDTDSVQDFAAVYQTDDWIKTFDTEMITCTEDLLVVKSHYCPLLDMWEQLTQDRERLAKVCDIAMDGDRALAHKYPNFNFRVSKTMAKGDDYCEVMVQRRQKSEK